MSWKSILSNAALGLLLVCQSAAASQDRAQPLLRDQAAIAALKEGGYVVYLRHGHTDPGRDTRLDHPEDCTRQRNLSAQGVEQSRVMGQAIVALGIPVTTVLASPLCRTRITAELALGTVRLEPELLSYSNMPPRQLNATHAFVRQQLAMPVAKGANVFLVGHSPAFDAATQKLQPPEFQEKRFLGEGDAALIRADGKGGFELVGHIGVNAWIGNH